MKPNDKYLLHLTMIGIGLGLFLVILLSLLYYV